MERKIKNVRDFVVLVIVVNDVVVVPIMVVANIALVDLRTIVPSKGEK